MASLQLVEIWGVLSILSFFYPYPDPPEKPTGKEVLGYIIKGFFLIITDFFCLMQFLNAVVLHFLKS